MAYVLCVSPKASKAIRHLLFVVCSPDACKAIWLGLLSCLFFRLTPPRLYAMFVCSRLSPYGYVACVVFLRLTPPRLYGIYVVCLRLMLVGYMAYVACLVLISA